MARKFVLAALAAVVAVAGWVSAAPAADETQQQGWAEFDAKVRPLMDQMYQKRSELASIYNSGNADQAKVETLYREIADLQAQLYSVHQEFGGAMANGGWACPGFGGAGCGFGGVGGGMGGGYGMRGGRGMGYGHGGYGMRGGWGGHRGGMGGGHCW